MAINEAKKDKMINRIKHMLNTTTEKGATPEEAENALLMAQRLMAQYGLEMSDVQDVAEQAKKEIIKGYGMDKSERRVWWKGRLANVIADNFRCYTYFTNYGDGSMNVRFLGVKEDVEIAVELFKYASKVVEHISRKYVKDRKKELEKNAGIDFKKDFDNVKEIEAFAIENNYLDQYEIDDLLYKYDNPEIYKMRLIMAIKDQMGLTVDATGMKNDYINGFLTGLREKFKEQVQKEGWGLIIVKDTDVVEAYNELQKSFTKGSSSTAKGSGDAHARMSGYKAGKSFNPSAPKGGIKG